MRNEGKNMPYAVSLGIAGHTTKVVSEQMAKTLDGYDPIAIRDYIDTRDKQDFLARVEEAEVSDKNAIIFHLPEGYLEKGELDRMKASAQRIAEEHGLDVTYVTASLAGLGKLDIVVLCNPLITEINKHDQLKDFKHQLTNAAEGDGSYQTPHDASRADTYSVMQGMFDALNDKDLKTKYADHKGFLASNGQLNLEDASIRSQVQSDMQHVVESRLKKKSTIAVLEDVAEEINLQIDHAHAQKGRTK